MSLRAAWTAALLLVGLAAVALLVAGGEEEPPGEPAAVASPAAASNPRPSARSEGPREDSLGPGDEPSAAAEPRVRFRPRAELERERAEADTADPALDARRPDAPDGAARVPMSAVPEGHRREAFEAALDDLPDWLEEEFGEGGPSLERLDCSEAPCLVWVDGGDVDALAAIQKELEERMGTRVVSVLSDGRGRAGFHFETPVLPGSGYTSADLGGSIGRRALRARRGR